MGKKSLSEHRELSISNLCVRQFSADPRNLSASPRDRFPPKCLGKKWVRLGEFLIEQNPRD